MLHSIYSFHPQTPFPTIVQEIIPHTIWHNTSYNLAGSITARVRRESHSTFLTFAGAHLTSTFWGDPDTILAIRLIRPHCLLMRLTL